MVHALQRAGQRLRRGGVLISLRPHRELRPTVAIVARGRRRWSTSLTNAAFERRLEAAEAALDRVVDDGRFTLLGLTSRQWRTSLDAPSQIRTYLELINPPRPRFPPGTRAALDRAWRGAPLNARIEIAESLIVTALRRN